MVLGQAASPPGGLAWAQASAGDRLVPGPSRGHRPCHTALPALPRVLGSPGVPIGSWQDGQPQEDRGTRTPTWPSLEGSPGQQPGPRLPPPWPLACPDPTSPPTGSQLLLVDVSSLSSLNGSTLIFESRDLSSTPVATDAFTRMKSQLLWIQDLVPHGRPQGSKSLCKQERKAIS